MFITQAVAGLVADSLGVVTDTAKVLAPAAFGVDSAMVHSWIGQIFPGINGQVQAVVAGVVATFIVFILGKILNWINPKLASGAGLLAAVTKFWIANRWWLNLILAAVVGKFAGGSWLFGLLGYGMQKSAVNAKRALSGETTVVKKIPRGGIAVILGVLLATCLFATSVSAAQADSTGFAYQVKSFPVSLLQNNVFSVGAGERWNISAPHTWGEWMPQGVWEARVTHVLGDHFNVQAEYEQQFKKDDPFKTIKVLGFFYW